MSEKYILLKEYKGWAKGAVITVAAPSRLADMNAGYGERYVEPEPEVKPNKTVKKKTSKKK